MNIVVDSCFWIALYDVRDAHHAWAISTWEQLQWGNKFLVPYPTMYEFVNTRLMRKKESALFFKALFNKAELVVRISDEGYKEDALHITFESTHRALSLIDTTIRLMLEDDKILKHALLTLNIGDFEDVCRKKKINIISE